jgi:hypothetical protein
MRRETYLEFIDNLLKLELHQYLIDKELIYDKIECIFCSIDMRLTIFEKSELGMSWRYLNSLCSHFQTTLSLLHNSFCHNSCISVKNI